MISPYGDKVYIHIKSGLSLAEALTNFSKMLVFKCFINRQVIISPAKVGSFRRSLSRPGRSRYSIDMDLIDKQSGSSQRNQRQLNGCSKTSRIGDFCCCFDLFPVKLRQTVNKIISIALQPEIVTQIDDLHARWNSCIIQIIN